MENQNPLVTKTTVINCDSRLRLGKIFMDGKGKIGMKLL